MKIRLLVVCLLFSLFAQAQNDKKAQIKKSKIHLLEDTISVLSQMTLNARESEARFSACHRMIPMLTEALKEPNSFDYKFEKLKTVSIQYPQDSSFRIITWQLYVDTSEYRYYGAIQMNSEDLQLHPLIDRSFQVQAVERQILSNKNWYGSVYYNLKQFKTPEGMKYLLFGYDGYSYYQRRKVIDVLYFRDGKPTFGAPVFVDEKKGRVKNRILLEYAANSSIRCNYDEFKEMVIFDHLLRTTSEVGGGSTSVPDGSFEGYEYVKRGGYWSHVEKMFHTVVKEAPREHPILDKKGKDLFGKKKN